MVATTEVKNTRPDASQVGFTLLETIIVFVLVGLVLAASVPAYRSYASSQRALTAARTLTSDLRVAQQEAVTRRADITVTFSNNALTCVSGASYEVSEGATTIKHVCLPRDVVWFPLPLALTWSPTGVTDTAATLNVRSVVSGKRHSVQVAAQTGSITDDTR